MTTETATAPTSMSEKPAGLNAEPVISVRDLETHFFTDEGIVRAVDGVNFDVHPGTTMGIVGESGCGKSITAKSILQIVEAPGRIVNGEINYRRSSGRNGQPTRLRSQ